MASLSLRHIYKIYQGGVKAVNDFNLEIDDKEFIVFVGPSGCGKSTTLRMIAGLEEISEGELYIDDRFVNDVEPKDRDIAMVFQNYALYPHMTVFDNMAFGLKLRRMPMAEINARVKEAAAILGIEALLTRKPKALSGGQRQRVALGRAIVREPKVFLLDEPLSNLDAKLRVQMRTEITKLHHKLATTFIYVTHDQTEAMTMGTRIVVMKDGLMQQVDSPQNLYDFPVNLFVAGFIGTPQMNFIPAVLENSPKGLTVKFGNNKILIPPSKSKRLTDEYYVGKEIIFGVRPEDIHDEEIFINSAPDAIVQAEIDVLEKLGNETMLYMKVDGKEENVIARVDARTNVREGQKVKFALDAKHIHMFDPETELTILGAPVYNFIPAYLVKKGDAMFVRIGDVSLPLAEDTEKRIINRDYINDKILAGIKPTNVIFAEEELAGRTDILTGEVDFVEKFPRESIVYIKFEGKERLFAAKAAPDQEFKVGGKVKFAFKDIELFDLDRKRIRAAKPVPYVNAFKTTATVAEGKNGKTVSYTVGKAKITVRNQGHPAGEVSAWIAPSDIMTAKEDVQAYAASTVRALVEYVDKLGGEVILYTRVEGIDDVVVVRTGADCAAEEGSKVKLAFNPEAISAGHNIPEPPAPKEFVEPAPAKKAAPAPAATAEPVVETEVEADATAEPVKKTTTTVKRTTTTTTRKPTK